MSDGKKIQFYLVVAGVIILFDVVASIASRTLKFDYTSLVWGSWCLYIAAGYFGCKFYGFLGGAIAGLAAGLADSTAGWMLSSVIGPNIPFTQPRYTLLLVGLIITIVTLKATFVGLIGALLSLATKRRMLRPGE